MRKSFAASLFAAFLLAVGGSTALAGNGNGQGNGNGNGHDAAAQPQAAQPQEQAQPAAQPEKTHGNPHAASSATVQTGGTIDHGVKPSSTTKHDTYAQAGSDKTKQYGNGKTAGKIATSRGASNETVLHGPGNSQPHKVAACPKKHEVDVHAVKSYSTASCGRPVHEVAAATHVQKHEVEHEAKHETEHVTKHETEHVTKHETVTTTVAAAEVAPAAAEKKVYICHATGSATNPYVLIHVSKNAEAAHTSHQDGRDIVLGDTIGAGCPQPAAVAAATTTVVTTTTPAVTTTEAAAVAATTTTTTTTTTAAANGGVLGATAQQSAPAATTPAQGGVLGAQATIAPKQPGNGGVLGTTGRIASSRLPFTGIELWIFALVAAALIAAGATLRRAGRGAL